MPLYEYQCLDCGKKFEVLVTGSRRPVCPSCHSERLEKLLSVFGVGGGIGASSWGSSAKSSCGSSGGG